LWQEKVIHIEKSIRRNGTKIGKGLSVISTGKDTHHQMQKAYLRGKRKPLEATSINTKQWIDDLKNINTQKGKKNA
tara:strand:+ start:76 stop:303 length:228 start_codon:yes stop_codon:yes gene_type:complete